VEVMEASAVLDLEYNDHISIQQQRPFVCYEDLPVVC